MNTLTHSTAEPIALNDRASLSAGRAPVLVRELTTLDRERLLTH